MINITKVENNNVNSVGLSITLPSGENHPQMLMILCKRGYVMCGYLNIAASDKFEDVAVIISGNTFEDLLNAPVKAVSEKAKELGITVGMLGKDAVDILNK